MKKLTKIEAPTPKLTLGVATGLRNLLPQFRTAYYLDVQRIEGILKKIGESAEVQNQVITDFIKTNNLAESEDINPNHPLYRELVNAINTAETQITKADVSKFSLEDLNAAIDGLNMNYNDRTFLMFWLVK